MRKKVRVRRPEPKPGTISPPLLFNVPETGQVTVRFLSEADTMFCHPGSERPIACAGEGVCPPGLHHKSPKRFYGYAAVERWRDQYEDWLPCVLEITESLWRKLQGRRLRGEVWTFCRQASAWSKREVTGEHVDTLDETRLRKDVEVYKVVHRVYGTDQILWGVAPELDVAPALQPTKDKPPINKQGKTAPPERLQARKHVPLRILERMTPEQRQQVLHGADGHED